MRYLLVYFTRRIANDLPVYVYTTAKSMKASVALDGVAESFNVTFWDGVPKEKSKGSLTMWLADKDRVPFTKEQALLYAEHFGREAILQVDADNLFELMSFTSYNALPKDEQKLVHPSVFAPSPQSA